MAEYHVGCGIAGIYAGTLNKKGNMWQNKSCVTDEALDAVAGYLVMHNKELRFSYNNEQYVMRVEKMEDSNLK